jgi:hypothetical protein
MGVSLQHNTPCQVLFVSAARFMFALRPFGSPPMLPVLFMKKIPRLRIGRNVYFRESDHVRWLIARIVVGG